MNELKDYRRYADVGDEYYDNAYDYPPIKNLLDSKVNQLKKFYSNYILNNADMFKYTFYIGRDYAIEDLNLGKYHDDKYDQQFDSVFNGVDTNDRVNGEDLVQILKNIISDVDDVIYDEIKNIKNEYQAQWNS